MGLGMINGKLTATWAQKYEKPINLTSPVLNITNSQWHTARLNVTKSHVTLELDDWISDPYQHNVESFDLNDNIIYLGNENVPCIGCVVLTKRILFTGGVPEEKYFSNDRRDLFNGNFRGCIEQLTVRENVITDFKHYESVNVDVCDTW